MKKFSAMIAASGLIFLSACTGVDSYKEVEALNEAQFVGSPFTQTLAGEYRSFANTEQEVMFDYPDAMHFARKGLSAATGVTVLPEPVSDWNLMEAHVAELTMARGRLVRAFDIGAREVAPSESAVAQARFDCWIEQQEENWQLDDIVACKSDFENAMANLEALLAQPVMQPPAMTPIAAIAAAPSEPMKPKDAMYLVFFDFDKSTIAASGASVIDAVADEVKARSLSGVTIIGHTDTSGARAYNKKLSLKRASAVKNALVKSGVDASLISIDSRGEGELLVETADGVREPANRRVTITFQ
jgi:OOP family OmpA-OmpF porin